jgi:predicted DNA binding CopG/RHH family protein
LHDKHKGNGEKTMTRGKRITIRIYDHDYQGIQKKALAMGIPYQPSFPGSSLDTLKRTLSRKPESV